MFSAIPPKQWFAVAEEIVREACKRTSLHDYKSYARLKPVGIGEDYYYRISVLRELLSSGVIKLVENDRLMIAELSALSWFDEALLTGSKDAWALEEICEQHSGKGRKFDDKLLAQIGQIGEEYVLATLKELITSELHAQIQHISVVDDTAGYDIRSPSTSVDCSMRFIEVKTSVRPLIGKFSFFLSRNEFERGIRDSRWCIVGVHL
ncbi:DUF3883 domain-containing protein, partial [Luminiphilus sp.]|nr:DUF3883 domain-containing protein [Luminiphilus sp.]